MGASSPWVRIPPLPPLKITINYWLMPKTTNKRQKRASLKETLEILRDPELMKAIREGEEDFKKGRFHDWEEVKKELARKD